MDNHVDTVFKGSAQVGGGQGGVHDQGNSFLMGHPGDLFKVGDIQLGVADGFHKDKPGLFINGFGNRLCIRWFDQSRLQVIFGKNLDKKKISGHEKGIPGYELVP